MLSAFLNLPAFAEMPVLERIKQEVGIPLASPLGIIPTSANTSGRHGAYFKTRVVLHKLTDRSYSIVAVLTGPSGIVGQRTLGLSAWQY